MTEITMDAGDPAVVPKQLNILVVDDDAINVHLIKTHLLRLGQKVDTARDGFAAVEKFKKNAFDVILMDIMMPVMDGVTATIEIRKLEDERKTDREHRAIIIAITANSFIEDRAGFFDAGMDHYMSKPFQMDELQRILNF